MPTFSNTPYEADQLSNLYDILQKLPNNTANLIKPKDVRDGVYTIWENILFKITGVTGSTYSYFGVDSDSYRTKFYLGKKTLSGSPIMSNTLLTSDSDYYIYNNKSDSNPSLQDTKISFLAGASASDYPYAPYLLAKKITSPSRIDLEFINPATNGVIAIGSTVNSVSVAGILFPPGASASVGNSLVYTGSNQLSWAATPVLLASSPFIPVVGTSGGLYNSHLKQNGNSVQIVNGRYFSDPSGLIRMNFMTGSGIELSTDGGALTTPNVIIDSNKISLYTPFGSFIANNVGLLMTHSYTNIFSTLVGYSYQNMFATSSNGTVTMTGSNLTNISSNNLFLYGINSVSMVRGTNSIAISGATTTVTGSSVLNISTATMSINALNQYQYNSKYSQIGTSASFLNNYTIITSQTSTSITGSQTLLYSAITQSVVTNERIMYPLTQSSNEILNLGWVTKIVNYRTNASGPNQIIYRLPYPYLKKGMVIAVKCFLQFNNINGDQAYTAEMYAGFLTTDTTNVTQLTDSAAGPNTTRIIKTNIPGGPTSATIIGDSTGIKVTIHDAGVTLFVVARIDYMITIGENGAD